MEIFPRRSLYSRFVAYSWLDYRIGNKISDQFMTIINESRIHEILFDGLFFRYYERR